MFTKAKRKQIEKHLFKFIKNISDESLFIMQKSAKFISS
jgi:hypothetical protein